MCQSFFLCLQVAIKSHAVAVFVYLAKRRKTLRLCHWRHQKAIVQFRVGGFTSTNTDVCVLEFSPFSCRTLISRSHLFFCYLQTPHLVIPLCVGLYGIYTPRPPPHGITYTYELWPATLRIRNYKHFYGTYLIKWRLHEIVECNWAWGCFASC